MKMLKTLVLILAMSMISSVVNASAYQGIISSIAPFNNKVYVVIDSGGWDGSVGSCQGNTVNAIFVIDPSTQFGRLLYATALSAKLTGRLVYVMGNGTCVGGAPYGSGYGEELIGLNLNG